MVACGPKVGKAAQVASRARDVKSNASLAFSTYVRPPLQCCLKLLAKLCKMKHFLLLAKRTTAHKLNMHMQAVERMQEAVHQHAKNHYHAFFSTELGGVVTDPAFMMIHMVSLWFWPSGSANDS